MLSKILKKFLIIASIMMLLFVPFAISADKVETLTFEWDQEDTTNLKEWRLYWSDTAGGPYEETPVAVISYTGGVGPTFEGDATASVVGEQGSTVTKHFVLVACGDIPQEGGGTVYECSENSNEVAYNFWIPAGRFSVPINFRILAE